MIADVLLIGAVLFGAGAVVNAAMLGIPGMATCAALQGGLGAVLFVASRLVG